MTAGLSRLARSLDGDPAWRAACRASIWKGPTSPPRTGRAARTPWNMCATRIGTSSSAFRRRPGGASNSVTLAPERRGALPFIEKLAASGVVVALGHTAASPETIRDAVRAGARLSTHLGNGSHDLLQRHPNYIWEQLANDDLYATIIADGEHLPASVVKCFARAKGAERMALVSDAVRWAVCRRSL